MPLRNLFGRGRDAAAPAPEQPEALPPDDESDVSAPELDEERSWRERAEAVLPTGASTGSKRAAALYGSDDANGPTHFVSARGCRVTDVDGNSYLDCNMALGAVALGYAEPRVTQAVVEAASQGNVSALSSWREVELAERLAAIIPCAERVQLFKTGAEADVGRRAARPDVHGTQPCRTLRLLRLARLVVRRRWRSGRGAC
jgi:Glutamate-1-semialdehyde aminotransferase